MSAELAASAKAVNYRANLDAIVTKIKAGNDLTPHLSRAVKVAHEPNGGAAKLNRRKDRDLLGADWGLHHLHLSTVIEADGFVERRGRTDLLFAAFTASDAYLIGLYPHGSWALKELLEIVVHNWPDAGLMLKCDFVLGLEREWTDDERLELREAGIAQPMIEIDGKVWAAAALGQSAAGTPSRAAQKSNVVMHTFRE